MQYNGTQGCTTYQNFWLHNINVHKTNTEKHDRLLMLTHRLDNRGQVSNIHVRLCENRKNRTENKED